jgi:tetratricopeptide (TPR) repeat protein
VLSREEKGVFLEAFWTRHNPLVLKYYYGYHLGRRHYTVSDVFFEKGDLIYPFFYREANSPDKRKVADGVRICAFIVEQSPDDAVALCGLGYFYLEQNNTDAAKKLFWKADKKQKRFMEARNGRALAILRTPKQKTQAQKLFEEIVSIDRDYEAAWYNLTIAHLSLESNGVFGQFEKMVKRFPEHYDAHFKLGASNERSHYNPKAVVSYINQLNVNPEHGRARFYAARSAIELIWMGLEWPEIPGFEIALKQNPKRYLPIQAEAYLSQKLYGKAEANYKDFIALLTPKEQTLYNDISLVTTPAEQQAWEQTPKSDQNRFSKKNTGS